MGTSQLLAGNLATLAMAMLAFLQLLPWPIAGYLIIASVLIASLTYLNPSKNRTSIPQEPVSNPVIRVPEKRPEKPDMRTETEMATKKTQPKLPKPSPAPAKTGSKKIVSPKVLPPGEAPQEGTGPEAPTRIGEGDYLSFEVELEKGEEVVGEASSSGQVNMYVLSEDNLAALDLDQEFWYEAGSEGVRNAALHFTAPESGRWFLVVENADDKDVFVTVKTGVSRASHSVPLLRTESLGLPGEKLES